jgi:hypothetical protein
MKRVVLFALAIVGFTFALSAQAASDHRFWQLTLQYDATSLRVIEAGQIPESRKILRTPGLDGAPLRVGYNIDWLDAGGATVTATTTELPIGFRTAPPENGGACQTVIPESGIIVIRLKGPLQASQPSALRFTRIASTQAQPSQFSVPAAVDFGTRVLPIERIATNSVRRDGPISATKLRSTGPDDNRLVFVVLGDGFTQANLDAGAFTSAANNFVSSFGGRSPWDALFLATNVYRIDVASNQQGSDNDPQGTLKDTYFNSSYWVSGIQRLLAIDNTGYQRAISAANNLVGYGIWDYLFVIVNSTTYGGSGGSVAVISVHPSANEVALHETGHTFAKLADEYSDPYPGYPAGDGEPNVDYDYSGSGLKWLVWVNAGTPLPTPNNSSYAGVVGAFEGARYLTTGIYRPWYNCLMRSLGVQFDPVCKEAHVAKFVSLVNLADSVFPADLGTNLVPLTGVQFAIKPLPIGAMAYQWKLGDSILPVTDSAITIKSTDLYANNLPGWGTLEATVTFPTPLVRKDTAQRTFTWDLMADCNGNGVDDATDISYGTSQDNNLNGIPDECDQVICCVGKRGNVNGVGIIDSADLAGMVSYLTGGMFTPSCSAAANMNGVGIIDSADLSALVSYLTGGGFVLQNCP